MGNHVFLTELTGSAPRFFRTGTAWYDDVDTAVVRDLGEIPIGIDHHRAFQPAEAEHVRRTGRRPPRMKDRGIVFSKLSELNIT